MRIAITADPVIPVPPIFYGGIERIIDLLINELLGQGHDVTLFAHKDSNVACRLIPYPEEHESFRNALVINKHLLAEKFDIIHSFGRLAYLLPQLLRRTPILMSYQREPTIRQIKKAMLISSKGILSFTGCSNYITDQIKPVAPAFTVYNGVDTNKYTATPKITDDAPLVFLGRIEPIKGPQTAIQIALKTNKKLVIAGNVSNDNQQFFDSKIKSFLGDQVTYAGPVNDEQKNTLLQNSLALLMPIHWNEPFGIVMVEAMACGTPVIGFKRGAVSEVIENGITGYYADNIEQLEDYVAKVHLLDRSIIRKQMEERFSAGVIAGEYLKVYEKLTANR